MGIILANSFASFSVQLVAQIMMIVLAANIGAGCPVG